MSATSTGRKPAGPQIIERLEGSPVAKQRLKVILETIAGRLTIPDACQQVGIGESRFHELRNQTLQATLKTLEPRSLGRPPKPTSPEQAEIDTLQAELRRLHFELKAAQTLIDVARIHPDLLDLRPVPDSLGSKKNSRSACQQRQQRRVKWRRRKAK
jgi:hypothetical protein